MAVVAVPVLRGEDGPTLGPGSAELADDLGIDLLSVLENAGATGATGEVTELPVARSADPDAAPVNPDLATVLLVGVGDATLTDVRRAAATLARHTLNTDVRRVLGRRGRGRRCDDRLRRRGDARLLRLLTAPRRAPRPARRQPGARVERVGRRPERTSPAGRRRCGRELAGSPPGERALQHQDADLAGGTGRERRGGSRVSPPPSSTRSSSPSVASAASWASARVRRPRPGSCSWTTSRPRARARPSTWCWWARASPSTAAASRSSPARPWSP